MPLWQYHPLFSLHSLLLGAPDYLIFSIIFLHSTARVMHRKLQVMRWFLHTVTKGLLFSQHHTWCLSLFMFCSSHCSMGVLCLKCSGGTEVTRFLSCLLGAFSQGLRNLTQLHSWAVFWQLVSNKLYIIDWVQTFSQFRDRLLFCQNYVLFNM